MNKLNKQPTLKEFRSSTTNDWFERIRTQKNKIFRQINKSTTIDLIVEPFHCTSHCTVNLYMAQLLTKNRFDKVVIITPYFMRDQYLGTSNDFEFLEPLQDWRTIKEIKHTEKVIVTSTPMFYKKLDYFRDLCENNKVLFIVDEAHNFNMDYERKAFFELKDKIFYKREVINKKLDIYKLHQTKLNKKLLVSQNVSESQIETLYELYNQLEVLINQSKDKTLSEAQYKRIGDSVETIEFELQKNWNFEMDRSFHTHYLKLDGCDCPRMDNRDDYGYRRWNNGGCKYHG